MLPAIVGLVLFAVALVVLYRLKGRDLTDCASILGLAAAPRGVETRGRTPEGFDFHQSLLLQGPLEGMPAELAVRNVRPHVGAVRTRRQISHFSVLSLQPAARPRAAFRLQPVGILGALEHVQHDAPPVASTGDEAFDRAYRLYAQDATAALILLTPELRQALLAFRARVAGDLPASSAGQLASGLLLGTFDVTPDRLFYYVYGSPTRKIALHLKQAAPLLARLAGAR